MAIKLHNLSKGFNKRSKRVGRGNASGHGTTATKGTKGQKARSGVSGLKLKGMRHIILSTPKLKGFRSLNAGKVGVITLENLNRYYKDGEVVSLSTLMKKKLVKAPQSSVKIISRGELTKKLEIKDCKLSASAKAKIESLGGKIVE